ncbi:GNAT family N-acetyltransferase [Micromonospora aurantiaca (nom. illeg.)]
MLTGRIVVLRPMCLADLGFFAELGNVTRVRSHVVGWDWPVSPDAQRDWYERACRDWRSRRLTVADPVSDEPVGVTGLWEVDWHNLSALTAIKLMPGLAPPGAGSDAIKLTMAWSFYEVGLRRLHSTILDFNAASLGAYVRKCGWRIEGREREAVFRRGGWHDLLKVAALRGDFDGLADSAEYVERVCGSPPVPAWPGADGGTRERRLSPANS